MALLQRNMQKSLLPIPFPLYGNETSNSMSCRHWFIDPKNSVPITEKPMTVPLSKAPYAIIFPLMIPSRILSAKVSSSCSFHSSTKEMGRRTHYPSLFLQHSFTSWCLSKERREYLVKLSSDSLTISISLNSCLICHYIQRIPVSPILCNWWWNYPEYADSI